MKISDKAYLPKCLSGSALKMIALVTMIIDHIASVLFPSIPAAIEPLFSIGSHSVTWYFIFRIIGRTAFPIYAFLITEGYIHTHNKKAYGTNLLIFALISEIPWNLEHSGHIFYAGQNVFFTLFLGFVCMYLYDKYKDDVGTLSVVMALMFVTSIVLRCDYGSKGMFFILFLYVLRDNQVLKLSVGTSFFARPWAVAPAMVLIALYNGKRGFIKGWAKYIFYIAYPAHILALYFIKMRLTN